MSLGDATEVQMTTHGNGTTDLLAPPQPAGHGKARLASMQRRVIREPSCDILLLSLQAGQRKGCLDNENKCHTSIHTHFILYFAGAAA